MSFQTADSDRSRATVLGLGAILLWGLLALLTARTQGIPPFQLTAMTFGIGGTVGLIVVAARGRLGLLKQPPAAWALGVYGQFIYHSIYFSALKLAPAAEASLVAYLWPLLIVLMSAMLPGEKLRGVHVAGALLGLAGVASLALGRGTGFSRLYLTGYGLAFASALIWSSYSVLSRRMASVPTEAVAGFCLLTALLATAAHLMFEATVVPAGTGMWMSVLLLGLGPVGLAFFLWDIGMKRGDIRLLGIASYATPVISTLALVLFGPAEATPALALACALIGAAAVLARR